MPLPLPPRPSLDWLRKTAKQRLKQLKTQHSSVRLADAQLEIAREHGFESWRKLKRHVEEAGRTSAADPPAAPDVTRDQVVQGFFRLVGTGQLDQVRQVLAAAPKMVHAVGPHPFWGGRPQALHVAIETKRRDMFELLLDAGADVNGVNDQYDYWSPLMLSINREREDMRDELLRRGARVGLLEALLLGDDRLVADLLAAGREALPAYAPNAGPLLNFARTPFAIDRLLDLGVPPDLKDRWGSTPIESMSRLGPSGQPLVRRLIARGVPAAPEEYARLGDRKTLAALIESDPSIARSEAVMMGAVDFGHHDLAEWLLAHGANVNARSTAKSRHTALHAAAWNGDLRMVKLLIAAGADVAARDAEHDGTPIDWAEVAVDIENNPACQNVVEYLTGLEGRPGETSEKPEHRA
jgi:ankyrin repeat protein